MEPRAILLRNNSINESTFTAQLLGSGVNLIGSANYGRKGDYFQAFTNLATGLERIGKLCVLIDFAIDHQGQFPTEKEFEQLKLRHDLIKITELCKGIKQKRNYTFRFRNEIDEFYLQESLAVLSGFAKGDRYANIDKLIGSTNSKDPITEWHKRVDLLIYNDLVDAETKATIEHNARIVDRMMSQYTSVVHQADDGCVVNDVFSASLQTGVYEVIFPFRRLMVLQIVRYYVELLIELEHEGRTFARHLAHFGEIFGGFYNNNEFLASDQDWTFES